MKSNRIIILAATIATPFVVTPSQAQNMDRNNAPPVDHGMAKAESTEGTLQEAKDIIGMDVLDSQDQRAGKVKDLFVDLQNGRIIEVILDMGGRATGAGNPASYGPSIGNGAFPGAASTSTEERMAGVPPACLTYNTSGKSLGINVTPEQLKNAPTFAASEWKDAAAATAIGEVYHHYAQKAPTFGNLERGTGLLGEAVINNQDQKLGRVNNLVVNLPAGEVDKVILASGGFLGIRSQLTALDPRTFSYDPDRDKLRLDMTPDSLKNSPHFKAGEWRTIVTSQAEPASKTPSEALTASDSENMNENNR